MTIETPFDQYRRQVDPSWIDYNGHMNMAYYLLAFDQATDLFFDFLGLDTAQRTESRGTTFAAEVHLCYRRELMAGAPIRITSQLLSYDNKRLRLFHQMYHEQDGYLAATVEALSLYVDLETRRVGVLPAAVTKRLAAVLQAHRRLGVPSAAARAIELPPIAEA